MNKINISNLSLDDLNTLVKQQQKSFKNETGQDLSLTASRKIVANMFGAKNWNSISKFIEERREEDFVPSIDFKIIETFAIQWDDWAGYGKSGNATLYFGNKESIDYYREANDYMIFYFKDNFSDDWEMVMDTAMEIFWLEDAKRGGVVDFKLEYRGSLEQCLFHLQKKYEFEATEDIVNLGSRRYSYRDPEYDLDFFLLQSKNGTTGFYDCNCDCCCE